MSKNERRRTPGLTATRSLAFFRRTLCHKTREQEAVLFRFSGFWSKQGSCSDLNQKAKKKRQIEFPPPDSWESQFFQFFFDRRSKKNWKNCEKVDFLRSRGGKLNFSLSFWVFRLNARGQNLGLEQTLFVFIVTKFFDIISALNRIVDSRRTTNYHSECDDTNTQNAPVEREEWLPSSHLMLWCPCRSPRPCKSEPNLRMIFE